MIQNNLVNFEYNQEYKINQKNSSPYFMALIFLSDSVFEIPIRFLNVMGISTIRKSFFMPSIVIKRAKRPLFGFTITSSVSGLVN